MTMSTLQASKPPPKRKRKQSRIDLAKLMSTRRGTAMVAGACALLAALVLTVFLQQYRRSVNGADNTMTVLVAKNLIEKGSSGTIMAEKSIFQTARVRKDDLKNGAIADPANLRGKVAVNDIYPGAQLLVADFAPATGGVRDRIQGDNRGISLPLDAAHGMIGDVQAGDHVDVFALIGAGIGSGGAGAPGQARGVLVTLMRDLVVLRAPKAAKSGATTAGQTQQVVLRANDAQVAKLAWASDNAKIWLTLRPKIGAEQTKPPVIDSGAMLRDAVGAARR
jgi:Flp pilus assembly protein CpaB